MERLECDRIFVGLLGIGSFAAAAESPGTSSGQASNAQFFGSLGLPPGFAYVVMVWEFLDALALIIGVWPRPAALVLIPDLLGAIVTVHGPAGFFIDNAHGGWEYPALWIVGLVTLALMPMRFLAPTSNLATAH